MNFFNTINTYLDKYKYYIIATCLLISILSMSAFGYMLLNPQKVVVMSKPKAVNKALPAKIYVDIKGAVINPGVYETNQDQRVIDIIRQAGGLTKTANTSLINLSKKVTDQMIIIIYTNDEFNKQINSSNGRKIETSCQCPNIINDACIDNKPVNDLETKPNITETNSTLININTATIDKLTTLPGIGESKANDIINYRKSHPFLTIEDIKKVSGIGEATYVKIKDLISI